MLPTLTPPRARDAAALMSSEVLASAWVRAGCSWGNSLRVLMRPISPRHSRASRLTFSAPGGDCAHPAQTLQIAGQVHAVCLAIQK